MDNSNSISKTLKHFQEFRYKVVFEGICIGVLAGVVVVLFRLVLGKAEHFLPNVMDKYEKGWWTIPLLLLFLLLAAGITALLLKWEPMISGSGIPQVEGEMQGFFRQNWLRVLIAKFAGGIITIGSGLSLGREGPSIQLGAMVGKGFSKVTKRIRNEERLLITCGASAGLAAAFNAPLAGTLFALEEVHKNFSVEVLLSSMAASITADFVSRNIFGLKPLFDFSGITSMTLSQFWVVILLGIFVGLVGVFHNICIDKVQALFSKVTSQYIRTVIPFLFAGAMLLFFPVVLGGGSNLIMVLSKGMPLKVLCVLFIVKFAFSIISFSSGVPGGIFLPLLVTGSLCGGIFYGVAAMVGMDLNLEDLIILGMVGAFASIVRAPVTGILLISEMTGNFTYLLFLTLAALSAYVVADMLQSKPIYEQLLKRMLLRLGKPHFHVESGEKILIEMPVHIGAAICGKKVSEINLPNRCLIISVKHREAEIVPNGETVLHSGDVLTALCDEHDSSGVNHALEKQCK